MHPTDLHWLPAWTLFLVGQASATFWLNQLDSYDSLPYCAEGPISSIVRDMVSGCGDGGRATSYSCFCTRSLTNFEGIIATAVAKGCSHWGTEAASATSLFHEYCQLGNSVQETDTAELSTITENASSRAIPADTITQASETETSKATSTTSLGDSTSTNNGLSTSSKIAIGVSIPVAAISICIAIFFFLRRRRTTKSHGTQTKHGLESSDLQQPLSHDAVSTNNQAYYSRISPSTHYSPSPYEKVELDANTNVVELPVSEVRNPSPGG